MEANTKTKGSERHVVSELVMYEVFYTDMLQLNQDIEGKVAIPSLSMHKENNRKAAL